MIAERIHRKIERTPEQLAELKAIREKFQRERPGPDDLIDDHWESSELSSIPCQRCGGACREFVVPNDVWNAVVRGTEFAERGEYLCQPCYQKAVTAWVRAASARAVQLEAERRAKKPRI